MGTCTGDVSCGETYGNGDVRWYWEGSPRLRSNLPHTAHASPQAPGAVEVGCSTVLLGCTRNLPTDLP